MYWAISSYLSHKEGYRGHGQLYEAVHTYQLSGCRIRSQGMYFSLLSFLALLPASRSAFPLISFQRSAVLVQSSGGSAALSFLEYEREDAQVAMVVGGLGVLALCLMGALLFLVVLRAGFRSVSVLQRWSLRRSF